MANLLKLSQEFYIKAIELDPNLDLNQNLSEPTLSDQEDIKILMKRAIKALNSNNIKHFAENLIALDRLIRDFKHENFDEEFYDFASDQDLWDWINNLSSHQLNKQDLVLLSIVKDNLTYFISKTKLFK